jgi:arabinofuranosyltransferase
MIGLYFIHVWSYLFLNDDAYISFRYAAHWAEYGEITYNLGERVEGYTNFLWVALLAAGHRLGADIPLLSYVLSLILSLGTFIGSALFATTLEEGEQSKKKRALIVLGLLAVSPSFVCWTSGGLEVQLFTACFTLGAVLSVQAWMRPEGSRIQLVWRGGLAGMALALAAMTRPEGVMFFGLIGLYRLGWIFVKKSRLTLLEYGCIFSFLLLYIPYFIWRYHYYGHIFPNTYYAKVGASGFWIPGIKYVGEWFIYHSWLLVGLGVHGVTCLKARNEEMRTFPTQVEQHIKWVALLCGGALCIHVARVGGDFMALHRFLVPLLPLGAVLCSGLFVHSYSKTKPSLGSDRWRMILGLFMVVSLPILAVYVHHDSNRIGSRAGVDSIGWLRQFSQQCAETGRFIKQTTTSNVKLATTAAGALPFYAERYTVDLLGLNDEWIAHQVPAKGHRPGHTKSAPFRYPIDQGVDYLIYHPTFSRNQPKASQRMSLALKGFGYHWESYRVPKLQPSWWGVWVKKSSSKNVSGPIE